MSFKNLAAAESALNANKATETPKIGSKDKATDTAATVPTPKTKP